MNDEFDDDDDWKPPTEAELKVLGQILFNKL